MKQKRVGVNSTDQHSHSIAAELLDSVPEERFGLADLAAVEASHCRLMRAYLQILRNVETPGFFVSYASRKSGKQRWFFSLKRFFTIRYLLTLFVHSHIRAKSDELRSAYVQLAQALSASEQRAAASWLMDTADSLVDFSSTLDSWNSVKGIFNLAWPVGVGFFMAWMQADNPYTALLNLSLPSIDLLLAIVMFPVVYLFLFLFSAFEHKRAMLCPKETSSLNTPVGDGPNIYKLENELFHCIKRRKTLEFPLDTLCYVCGTGTFGVVPIYLALHEPRIDWVLISSGAFFVFCALVMTLRLRKRQWR